MRGSEFFTVVYIHPKANFDRALDIIFNLSHKLESLSPESQKKTISKTVTTASKFSWDHTTEH